MNLEQPPSNQNPVSDETSSANVTATDEASASADPAEQAAAETSEINTASLEKQSEPIAAAEPVSNDTVEIPVVEIPAVEIPAVEIPAVSEQSPPAESAEVIANEASSTDAGPDTQEKTAETESEDPSTPKARPRVKLNPTVDPGQAVAVPSPSLAGPAATPAVSATPLAEESSAVVADAAAAQAAAPPAPPTEPVELPPANEQLDSGIEAEIAAAMSNDESSATAAAVEAGEATTDSEQPTTEDELEPGTKLKGRVQSIQKENILLDVGFRASAMVQLRQFEGRKQPQLGQELEIVIDRYDAADGVLLASLPRMARSVGNWDEVAVDQVVQCMVKKSNKGGLEVAVNNLRGFLPASQVDLGYVADLDDYVGQKLTVKIIEVKPEKRNLVVSRRAILEGEREEIAEEMWQKLEKGQTHTGKVKTIKDYGAFVDIGGIDGLLHIAEMSWSRINHPRDVLSPGQELDVQIIRIDPKKKKISLSLRQLKKNPWDDAVARFPVESIVNGKVTNITDFGAFVEIEEGVEGLVHISEIDHKRINKVTDVLKLGEEVEAKVVTIDTDKKRIGLSIKALKHRPERPSKPKDEDLAPSGGEPFERKHKGPLKGGTGSGSGPLFG